MGIEIERKFLLDKETWKSSEKGQKEYYQQGYIQSNEQRTVRVRLTDSSGFITIKGPAKGFSRSEFEYPIPKQDAAQLLELFCFNVVSKWRYKTVYKGKLWEVDEFMGDNEGLFVAEIELKAEDETFDLPAWIRKEVTGDKRYSNSNLALNPYKNWK